MFILGPSGLQLLLCLREDFCVVGDAVGGECSGGKFVVDGDVVLYIVDCAGHHHPFCVIVGGLSIQRNKEEEIKRLEEYF